MDDLLNEIKRFEIEYKDLADTHRNAQFRGIGKLAALVYSLAVQVERQGEALCALARVCMELANKEEHSS